MVAANAVSGIVKVEQNGIWSNALSFVVPQSAGTSVTLSPNLVSMVVGQTRSLQALDNTGSTVTGLSWTSSDTTLATLSTDDPPIITAVAPGHVTIMAGNASTDVTIYADSLPLGTINWSVPGDSSGVINLIAAVPSDTGVADVFAHSGGGNIQAIRTDGSVAWTTNIGAPGPGLRLIPDFQGGLTFVKTDPVQQPTQDAILRLDGITGQSATVYNFQNKIETQMTSTVDEPRRTRIFTDGTVIAVDGDTVIGIDPQTRASKFSIQLEHSTSTGPSGHCIGDNTNTDQFPALGSFIVGGDGYAYLVYQYSSFAVTPFGAYEVGHQEEHTRVLRVGPGGDSSKIAVNDWTDDWNARFFCPSGGLMSWAETQSGARASLVDSSISVPPGGAGPLITNADQGVLLPMTLNWGGYFACESSNCFVSIPLSATNSLVAISSSGSVSKVPTNIPGQIGRIIPSLQAEDGTFFGQVDDSMIAFDQSGTPKWKVPVNFTPILATADGGLIARSQDGTSVTFDSSGRMTGASEVSGGVPSWFNNWYVASGNLLTSVVQPTILLAPTWDAVLAGNPSGTPVAIQQPLFAQLDSCIDTMVTPRPPCPGVREAIFNGEKGLVKTLATPDCSVSAQTNVFDKLTQQPGLTTKKFLDFLQQKQPQFYDGTKSRANLTALCQGLTGFDNDMCSLQFALRRKTIAEYFASFNGALDAVTVGGNNPLIVFFRPGAIELSGNGDNTDNEALVFHEALHGFTALSDDAIERDLGLSSAVTEVIDQYLIAHVFTCKLN
jgi:hypothetical protein